MTRVQSGYTRPITQTSIGPDIAISSRPPTPGTGTSSQRVPFQRSIQLEHSFPPPTPQAVFASIVNTLRKFVPLNSGARHSLCSVQLTPSYSNAWSPEVAQPRVDDAMLMSNKIVSRMTGGSTSVHVPPV